MLHGYKDSVQQKGFCMQMPSDQILYFIVTITVGSTIK